MDVTIPVLNVFCLILIIVGIRLWQKRHGKLSEKAMTLVLCGYGSLWTITNFTAIYFETNHSILAVLLGLLFLIMVWSVGYLFARWLYRQIYSKRG
jgi:hypothetical protein